MPFSAWGQKLDTCWIMCGTMMVTSHGKRGSPRSHAQFNASKTLKAPKLVIGGASFLSPSPARAYYFGRQRVFLSVIAVGPRSSLTFHLDGYEI